MMVRRSLHLDDLIEEVFPVDEAVEAYRRLTGAAEQRPGGAVVLSYGDAAVEDGDPEPVTVACGAAAHPGGSAHHRPGSASR